MVLMVVPLLSAVEKDKTLITTLVEKLKNKLKIQMLVNLCKLGISKQKQFFYPMLIDNNPKVKSLISDVLIYIK